MFRLTVITFGVFSTICIAEEPWEEWVAIYDSTNHDVGDYIACDINNDVYVTGSIEYSDEPYNLDCITIKYDKDGNELWTAVYHGPDEGDDHDSVQGIVVDSDSNVYITGWSSSGSYQGRDYFTIKYDSSGNEKWVARYNGAGNENDLARGIDVDMSGNVYVTGIANAGSTGGICTIKYNSSGGQEWIDVYNPSGDYASGHAIKFDNNNIYVTGYYKYYFSEFCTVKYDINGNRQWTSFYSNGGSGGEKAFFLDVDPYGNVFVGGSSWQSTQEDFGLVKYDSNGNELWDATFDGPDHNQDVLKGIACDSQGNVCVTGEVNTPDNFDDYYTIMYDSGGNEVWTRTYNGPYDGNDWPVGIVIDEANNVYVTGRGSVGYGEKRPCTIKYDNNGYQKWILLDEDYDSFPQDIIIDEEGYCCITGGLAGGNYDIWTIKYGYTGVPVVLYQFSAEPKAGYVVLIWNVNVTENENVEGFNLYRRAVNNRENQSVAKTGGPTKAISDGWIKVNKTLIAGANPYAYVDEGVEPDATYEYELEAVVNNTTVTLGTTTATTGARLPTTYALHQSRPNPATGTATIAFDLPEVAEVTLTVYDISGRKVTTLADETMAAGEHERTVSALAPGVYVYKLSAGSFSAAKKMVVVD